MFVAPNVVRFADTVNVYLLRSAGEAILVDFGSGDVLDHLGEFDVTRVTDVLLTHYHRDVTQGLARAHEAGIRIWAPPTERDLIERVDEHWQARPLDNVYDLREDRFALLEPVPTQPASWMSIGSRRFGAVRCPDPADSRPYSRLGQLLRDRRRQATGFHGRPDQCARKGLVAGRDTVDLHRDRGTWLDDPVGPRAARADTGSASAGPRRADRRPAGRRRTAQRATPAAHRPAHPGVASRRAAGHALAGDLEPHLLRNRTSVANTYALLSDDGAALLIDYGYDFTTGLPERDGSLIPPAVAGDHPRPQARLRDRPRRGRDPDPLPRRPRGRVQPAARRRGDAGLGPVQHDRATGGANPVRLAVPLVRPDCGRSRAPLQPAVSLARIRDCSPRTAGSHALRRRDRIRG